MELSELIRVTALSGIPNYGTFELLKITITHFVEHIAWHIGNMASLMNEKFLLAKLV